MGIKIKDIEDPKMIDKICKQPETKIKDIALCYGCPLFLGLNVWYDNVDEFTARMWLSNNDKDRILKFENEVLKIINNRIIKLNNEMQRFEKMKMLVGE